MKPRTILLLPFVLGFYCLLYIATKPNVPCDGDCELVEQVTERIRNNRESYVYHVQRCTYRAASDTLCVYVKDTTGIDWNLLADSTCYFATQVGLRQQKVFILKPGFPNDTVARRQCP
jgi:cadmium resistance protein CadD (predicted permease)